MDRNLRWSSCAACLPWSLSARRAWIEILIGGSPCTYWSVALRKESVDRNTCIFGIGAANWTSLSARRAWIEIFVLPSRCCSTGVALRKESVDRNLWRQHSLLCCWVALRKESVDRNCGHIAPALSHAQSLSARRAWIEIIVIPTKQIFNFCRSPQGERG